MNLEKKLTWRERLTGRVDLPNNTVIDITPKFNVTISNADTKNPTVEVTAESSASPVVDPLEPYRIGKEPFYLPQDGEADLFDVAFKRKLPVMLKGPTGTGKTRFVEYMAWKLGVPLITVSCQEDLKASD